MKKTYIVFLTTIFCCACINAHDVFKFEIPEINNDNKVVDGLCPNNKTKCATGTCCKTKHNSYHCCRYENAVCCSDRYHCCPEGTTCDLKNHHCQRQIDPMKEPMEWKVEDGDSAKSDNLMVASTYEKPLEDEPFCPNNKSRCKATKTCCITKHGNYYCCPHKNAVCCSDKWTCCPEGSTCDVKHKKCIDSKNVAKSDGMTTSELEPTEVLIDAAQSFLSMFFKLGKHCGNSQKSCPGEKRCCPMTGGNYGCCKYRKGVCCPDFASCCPHDTQCDIKNKVCTAVPDSLVPTVEEVKNNNDLCPDNSTQCSDSETCCSVGNKLYGCCPMKDATCCADKASCCPHGKTCDLKRKRCVSKDDVVGVEILKVKEAAIRKSLMTFLSAVGVKQICPNNSDRCEDSETCCSMGNNRFGCCPYTQAVCCPDHATCCPSNTKCSDSGCV